MAAPSVSLSPLLSAPGGFIAGQWVRDTVRHFSVRNPATGERLARLPAMGAREAEAAVAAADEAMRRPVVPAEIRADWLMKIAGLLAEHREDLARIITLEQGKPLEEARVEVDYGAGFFRFFGERLQEWGEGTARGNPLAPHRLPGTKGKIRGCTWTVHHRPAGVAALITPWNFPLAMLAKKMAAALGAGCALVAKPSELTPLTTVALWKLLEGIGLPRGQANLLLGAPEAIGGALCRDERVRLLSFTGSTAVGRLLYRQSAGTLKRLALELGGNAPFLVFEDADVEAAVDALMANKFRCAGQTCVCTNRVYLHRRIHAPFVEALAERVRALKVGNGMEPGVQIGPLINREGFRKVATHVADALRRGAKRVVGSAPKIPRGDWGFFFPPTVLTGVTPQKRAFREETFGPVISIFAFASETEALREANGTPYGLAAYTFTQDAGRAERVAAALRFGHVALNSGTGPTPEAPFGGFKQSGFGREGGLEGLLEFCESQTVASAG